MLTVLDLDKIRIKVNTSDYVIKEVLSMEYNNKQWKPITYPLNFLNKMKRNYKIHNKKILAVIRRLKN